MKVASLNMRLQCGHLRFEFRCTDGAEYNDRWLRWLAVPDKDKIFNTFCVAEVVLSNGVFQTVLYFVPLSTLLTCNTLPPPAPVMVPERKSSLRFMLGLYS